MYVLVEYLQSIEHPRADNKNLADHIITVSANNRFGSNDFDVNLQFYKNKIEKLHQKFINSNLLKGSIRR